MNSDPHDSAAWRAFGMLDADETAAFDEAMRDDPELMHAMREIECLSAAVAAASTAPVVPKAGQLERLQLRLGLNTPRRTNWAAISGWAAAAAVTLLLAWNHTTVSRTQVAIQEGAARPVIPHLPAPARPTTVAKETDPTEMAEDSAPDLAEDGPTLAITRAEELRVSAAADQQRLNHEISALRNQLASFEKMERDRFEAAVPGMAWPVVMRMSPPGSNSGTTGSLTRPGEDSPVTTALVDAMTGSGKSTEILDHGKGEPVTGDVGITGLVPPPDVRPFAVPIYDLARDTGTLMVSNLPPIAAGESYNLWVKTSPETPPIHVGKLPQMDYRVADSFDFNLGKAGIVPTAFILTKDVQPVPPQPTESSTVLEGPK